MVGTRSLSRLPISPLHAPPDAIPSTGPELHHPISNTTRDGITEGVVLLRQPPLHASHPIRATNSLEFVVTEGFFWINA